MCYIIKLTFRKVTNLPKVMQRVNDRVDFKPGQSDPQTLSFSIAPC